MCFLLETVLRLLRATPAHSKEPVTEHFVLGQLTVPAHALDVLAQGGDVVQAGPGDHIVAHHHAHAELLTLGGGFDVKESSRRGVGVADHPDVGQLGAEEEGEDGCSPSTKAVPSDYHLPVVGLLKSTI